MNNLSSSLPNDSLCNESICEICYENKDIIFLQCCNNSKVICHICISYLLKPICPWCRQELPKYLLPNNYYSKSLPDDYNSFLHSELNYALINPYSEEFADSRVLRRTLRNIRRNFNRNRQNNRQNNREINRINRNLLRQTSNEIANQYNRNNITIEDTIFPIDI